jgi:hypothetical protein
LLLLLVACCLLPVASTTFSNIFASSPIIFFPAVAAVAATITNLGHGHKDSTGTLEAGAVGVGHGTVAFGHRILIGFHLDVIANHAFRTARSSAGNNFVQSRTSLNNRNDGGQEQDQEKGKESVLHHDSFCLLFFGGGGGDATGAVLSVASTW